MRTILQDVRFAGRTFGKAPGFTLAAVLALALGTGANTAIFSVVDAVLLRPLPFREPGRVMVLWEKNPARNKYKMFVAPANLFEWEAYSRSFEALAGVQPARVNLTAGPGGAMEPEELTAERVSAGLFPLLGVQPALGRGFRPDEDQPGKTAFAVLSHALWQRRFGGDPGIVGRGVRLRDQNCTVLGVMPPGFQVMNAGVDVWLPLGLSRGSGASQGRTLTVLGRLRPGVSAAAAAAEMEALGKRLEQKHPELNLGWAPSLFTLREAVSGAVRTPLLVLLGAVGFLLAICCVNVANLLLARAGSRRRELAVRTALGASRGRIIGQLLTESVVLALAGSAAGVLIAWTAVPAILRLAPASLPRLNAAAVNPRVLLFTLGVAVLTGVLFGLMPALQVSGNSLNLALKEGGRGGTTGRAHRRMRNVLVVAEVALAVVVLTGAGLLLRSFQLLRAADHGFQPAQLLTARVPLAGGRNAAEGRRPVFFRELTERLARAPGVKAAGAVSALPLTGLGIGTTFSVEGVPQPPAAARPMGLLRSVAADYFGTMGIPLVAGRTFNAFDTKDAPPVALVSAGTARRHWPGRDPLGVRVTLDQGGARTVTVVGVVGDVKADRPDGENWPVFYLPYPQAPAATMNIVLRTAGRPADAAGLLRQTVRELDRDQPLAEVRPMEDVLAQAVSAPRFHSALLAVFAGLAFALAAIGVYGVVACGVAERTGEIGIRMALGATAGDVTMMLLKEGALLAGLGVAAGLAAALGLTRLMSSMLYAVRPFDAATYLSVAVALGAVALAAILLPSRRAASVAPAAILRSE